MNCCFQSARWSLIAQVQEILCTLLILPRYPVVTWARLLYKIVKLKGLLRADRLFGCVFFILQLQALYATLPQRCSDVLAHGDHHHEMWY
jgi:hypothetical protein